MAASIRALSKKYPLVANCVTYGTLYAGAEFSQQTYLRKIAVINHSASVLLPFFALNDLFFKA